MPISNHQKLRNKLALVALSNPSVQGNVSRAGTINTAASAHQHNVASSVQKNLGAMRYATQRRKY